LSLFCDDSCGSGNCLTIISEYFRYGNDPGIGQPKIRYNLSTVSLNYPLFLSHSISGLVYYNWDTKDWYRFLSLQLKYDYMSFYLMAFWNPDQSALYRGNDNSGLFTGKGFQLMLVLDI